MDFKEICSRFRIARASGDHAQAYCPVHNGGNEKHPSLTLTRVGDDKTLCYCHYCKKDGTPAIVDAVGLKMSDLMPENKDGKTVRQFAEYKGAKFVTSYDYSSDQGYAFTKCRVLLPDGDKSFRYCQTDNYGKVVKYGVKDKKKYRALYPFRSLQEARDDDGIVLYVEGEKDAENADRDGFHAITAGAAEDWFDALADHFNGLSVVVVPDNDEAGRKCERAVVVSLQKRGIPVKVIQWDEDFKIKGDYSDFVDGFSDRAEGIAAFKEKIRTAAIPEPIPEEDINGLAAIYGKEVFVNVNEDFNSEIPDTPWIVEGLAAKGTTVLLSGASKAGKSYMVTQLAVAAAMGTRFLNQFKCSPVPVLYMNGENTQNDARRRFQKVCHALYVDPKDGQKITMACLDGRYEAIGDIEDALIYEIRKGGYGLLIIDPLYCFFKGSEVDEQDAKFFVTALKEVSRETEAAVVCVHHHSKGGQSFYSNASSRASGSGMLQRAFSSLLDLSEIRDGRFDLPEGTKAFEFNGEIREAPSFKMNLIYQYPLWKYDEQGLIPDNALNKARTAAASKNNSKYQRSTQIKETMQTVLKEAFTEPLVDDQGEYVTFWKVQELFLGRDIEVSERTLGRYFDNKDTCVTGYKRDFRSGHKSEIRKQDFEAASADEQGVFS